MVKRKPRGYAEIDEVVDQVMYDYDTSDPERVLYLVQELMGPGNEDYIKESIRVNMYMNQLRDDEVDQIGDALPDLIEAKNTKE